MTKKAPAVPAPASSRNIIIAGVLLALATLAAYHNSFFGPLVYDDVPTIRDNPTIRHLTDLGTVLSPPNDSGITVNGRPFLNLSLAINYAIGGPNVIGYHIVNLAIHLCAGLTLFGLVRRTLQLPGLINPAHAGAHFNLAVVFSNTGQPSQAILQLDEALRRKPDYAEAQTALAQLRNHLEAAPEPGPTPPPYRSCQA